MRIRSAVLAFAVFGLISGPAAPAQATFGVSPAACDISGHTLNTSSYWNTSGNYRVWDPFNYQLGGAGTGGKSNLTWRVRQDGTDIWVHTTADDKQNGVQYSYSPTNPPLSLISASERVKWTVWFDVFGSDPTCDAFSPII